MEAMSDETFRFEARWQLTTLHPLRGDDGGGTRVTLAGSGVGDVDGLRCRIGPVVVESEKSSGSSVVCVMPMHRAGTVRVGLCYGGSGHCGAGEIAFEYVSGGSIESLVPSSGPESGGTQLTMVGNGFRNDSRIACMFGAGLGNTVARFVTASTVTCTTPRHVAEAVRVDIVYGSGWPAGSGSDAYFMFWREPELLTIRPSAGPIAGGYRVELTGRHLATSKDAKCLFGSVLVPALVENGRMICLSPGLP